MRHRAGAQRVKRASSTPPQCARPAASPKTTPARGSRQARAAHDNHPRARRLEKAGGDVDARKGRAEHVDARQVAIGQRDVSKLRALESRLAHAAIAQSHMVDRRLRYVRKRQIARRRADLRQTRLQQAQPRSGAVAQVNTVEPPFIHRAANEAGTAPKRTSRKVQSPKSTCSNRQSRKTDPSKVAPFAHSYASSTSSTRTLEAYPSPSEKTASNSSSPMRASCAAERANPTGAFAPAWLRPACRSPLVIRSSHAILFTARPPCAVPPGTRLALSLSTFRSAWRQTQRRHHHQLTRRVQHQSMASERATWASSTHATGCACIRSPAPMRGRASPSSARGKPPGNATRAAVFVLSSPCGHGSPLSGGLKRANAPDTVSHSRLHVPHCLRPPPSAMPTGSPRSARTRRRGSAARRARADRRTAVYGSALIDATDAGEVRGGDIITLIGEDGGERITVEEVVGRCGTISNEILSRLGSRLGLIIRQQ